MSKAGRYILLACLLGLSASASAEYGTTAAAYLRLDPSVRSSALGGSFVGMANDAGAVFHNPAGIGLLAYRELMFTHMELLQGMRSETLVYVLPLESEWSLGFSGQLMTSGAMDKYTAGGDLSGDFSSSEGNLAVSAARRFDKNLIAGGSLKLLYQGLDTEKGYAAAADLGALYSGKGWRVGASVQNLGTEMKLHDASFPLPLSLKAGGMYRVWQSIAVSAQATKYVGEALYFGLGVEAPMALTARDFLFFRAGFRTGASEGAGSGLSFGAGIRDNLFEFNYSLTPMGDLGAVHRFSLGYRFGERVAIEPR